VTGRCLMAQLRRRPIPRWVAPGPIACFGANVLDRYCFSLTSEAARFSPLTRSASYGPCGAAKCASNRSPDYPKARHAFSDPIPRRKRGLRRSSGGKATTAAIGKDKVGIRLSPFGVLGDLSLYPEMEADYA